MVSEGTERASYKLSSAFASGAALLVAVHLLWWTCCALELAPDVAAYLTWRVPGLVQWVYVFPLILFLIVKDRQQMAAGVAAVAALTFSIDGLRLVYDVLVGFWKLADMP